MDLKTERGNDRNGGECTAKAEIVKISRIVCCCDNSHEVLRVQPISARRSKTARLHMRAMECWSKRGARHTSEPGYRITRLCMSRKSEAYSALGLAES